MAGVPGYTHLRYTGGAAAKPAEQQDTPAFLAALDRVGAQLGKVIDIFSGSGGPSVRGGGFVGDPHDRRIAADAQIDGVPIGNYPGAVAAIHAQGLRSGATDFTYQGKSDPAHVDAVSGATSTGSAPSIDYRAYFSQVLKSVGAPVTQQNLDFLAGWAQIEGTSASYNPLATTMRLGGSTPFNSVGVQNYTSGQAGVAATAQTIKQGYPSILSALRSGNAASQVTSSGIVADLNKWVSGTASPVPSAYTRGVQLKVRQPSNGFLSSIVKGVKDANASGNFISDPFKGAAGAITAVPDFLGKLTDPAYILRGLQVIAGGVLVLVGVILLTRQVALAADLPDPAGLAGKVSRVPLPGTGRDIYQRDN